MKTTPIRTYRRKNFELSVTPEGKRAIINLSAKDKRLLRENLSIRDIHRKIIRNELPYKKIELPHKHQFASAIRQVTVSKKIPKPYALLRLKKGYSEYLSKKIGGIPWHHFIFNNQKEVARIRSAVFREVKKLAKRGLLPFDFRPRNIVLRRTPEKIYFHFIDTSVLPHSIPLLNEALTRAELPQLPEDMPIRKAQRWYLRLPRSKKRRIQEAIITDKTTLERFAAYGVPP